MTDPTPAERDREPRRWLDDKRNVARIAYALYGICGLLLAVDLLVPKHSPFAIEHNFGFYGVFGFAAYVALVVVAEALRRLVMRPEDYYDA